MADDLRGSYEHAPPNLLELAARDRRWCQGNLQHTRLLGTAGFHPLSRLHLFMGVMSYLASPLWLLFLLAGMSLALHAAWCRPTISSTASRCSPTGRASTPSARWRSSASACWCSTLPKLLGTAAFLGARESRRGCASRTILGLLVEVLLSALVAPIMMLVQTSSVIQIVTGRDSGWSAQARDSDRVPWSILWRFHRRHVLVGLLLAAAAGAISWRLLAWMSPALLGLVLAVPLSAFMGSARVGRGAAPASASSSPRRSAARRPSPAPPTASPTTLARPRAARRSRSPTSSTTRRRSSATSPGSTRRPRAGRGEPDAALASALLKLADGLAARPRSTPARPTPSSPRPARSRGLGDASTRRPGAARPRR